MRKLSALPLVPLLILIITLSSLAKDNVDRSLPEYTPFKQMISQSQTRIDTKKVGQEICYHIDYDRNGDSGWKVAYDNGFGGRDLIEFRRIIINAEGKHMWERHPYILIIDDDFDRLADRALIDTGLEKDGKFDYAIDLKGKTIKMDKFDYTLKSIM